jgi:CheY-like chemotaxis protein
MAAANLFIDALKLAKSPYDQRQIISLLDQSMTSFNDMLDSLLNVSKFDAGMIKPDMTMIYVAEIFNWLEQNCAPVAKEKKIGFKLYLPMQKELLVSADIGMLRSVLLNLVTNAIKFTAQGGVLISARKRDSEVLFQVWDTGIGISPENSDHIFDEFYQVNNPQRDRTKGLGLGLAIAKRAIALQGGNINCRSKLGRGSVFEFRLPLLDMHDIALSVPSVKAPELEDIAYYKFVLGKRFVIIEDDALVAQAMTNLLEGMGAEVKCFNNAEYALHQDSLLTADYFIVDHMLAGKLTGIQFLNQLRLKLGKPVKAILMTGDTSSGFMRNALECAWPILHKPVNAARVLEGLSKQE